MEERDQQNGKGASIGAIRQQSILSLIDQGHIVSVGDFAKRFSVANETIRRDIRALEEAGKLRRVHGGAVPTRTFDVTARRPLTERMEVDREGKMLAAKAAMALLEDDMHVFLGVSSTMLLVAEEIARSDKKLSVTTNSIDIGLTVAASTRCTVNLLGGVIHHRSRALDGYEVLSNFEGRLFDLSLLGASAISPVYGALAPSKEHQVIGAAAADRSHQVAFVVDHAKFNRRDAQVVRRLEEFDFLATDKAPPTELADALVNAGVTIFLPPTKEGAVAPAASDEGNN
ncbi:DeoR/GlpR family DNA-binding transcription regulator [Rhizobium miluonense]|uniref:Transcriptional regulator, DeoR family n=1 Tax=Rhizobium miluonense TaxID=411945 RepID=A0A1C3WDA0_9HYPH|nr:DeoR/GlpR family DNA-binding transcription regulator [Rhizobium miluonense]SCB38132.1 transcriptional regulator, DeoR family [Rhizobium miluonense]